MHTTAVALALVVVIGLVLPPVASAGTGDFLDDARIGTGWYSGADQGQGAGHHLACRFRDRPHAEASPLQGYLRRGDRIARAGVLSTGRGRDGRRLHQEWRGGGDARDSADRPVVGTRSQRRRGRRNVLSGAERWCRVERRERRGDRERGRRGAQHERGHAFREERRNAAGIPQSRRHRLLRAGRAARPWRCKAEPAGRGHARQASRDHGVPGGRTIPVCGSACTRPVGCTEQFHRSFEGSRRARRIRARSSRLPARGSPARMQSGSWAKPAARELPVSAWFRTASSGWKFRRRRPRRARSSWLS